MFQILLKYYAVNSLPVLKNLDIILLRELNSLSVAYSRQLHLTVRLSLI